jgi:drug/metabolite transporter (DMT)-like permease
MAKNPGGLKEFWRKRLVGLKRKPQTIALAVLAIGFLYYSLNLTQISNTTARIQGVGMGLAGFATMLFSILSLVCFLNAFPHRKKVNIPMLVLMLLMVCLVIYCDIYYGGRISAAINRPENPIDPTGNNAFIGRASVVLVVHTVILAIGLALVALLPVYSKMLRKINTNIEVEGNSDMGAIDISGEDA